MMASKYFTTAEKASAYDAVAGVFAELFKELKELGRKKPETTLSRAKVGVINRVLADIQACLDGEPEHKYLDMLDDDTLPQYGDAILILSQYEGAMTAFKSRHYGYQADHSMDWYIKGR